jgi:predicted transcriptional regulator YdeE
MKNEQKQTVYSEKQQFQIIGVSARTTNQREKGPNGLLPGLWEQYFKANLSRAEGIRNPEWIYALYTDYESDASGAYTVVIGHEKVDSAQESAISFETATIPSAKYMVFTTKKGPVYEVVQAVWGEIWAYFQGSSVKRTYSGDFELYDARNFNPAATTVDVYIAIE